MNVPSPLTAENTALVLIDVQEKLFAAMPNKEKLLRNLVKLIRGLQVLAVPVVLTEQYPKGLGPTLAEIKALFPDLKPIEKLGFSCCDEEAFCRALEALRRKQILLAGIEAHVCIYQTALDLARHAYEVQVVTDGVASREPENKKIALFRLGTSGVGLTTTEMALFELLKAARGDKFKQISSIVK